MFETPGSVVAASISPMSFSYVIPERHFSRGLSMTVVSYISSGALSVALSDRPTAPNTLSTSGKDRRIRSCSCKSCEACVMEIPGSAVGMYSEEPSNKGGMN